MKIREDFVTNSSSSSFIVSRDDISRDKLLAILLEIANEEADSYWRNDNRKYTMEDVSDDTVAYRYHIQEATLENPYENYDDYGYLGTIEKQYNNHFIIDNDSNGRYDWDIIEEILAKYNIPWQSGYCD